MSTPGVLIERDGAIATVILNRPEKLNAINSSMVTELCHTLKTINADDSVKVVILKGSGRAFCVGADLDEQNVTENRNKDLVRKALDALQEVTRQMLTSKKIIVGAIHGWAVGAGLEWAINCDFPIWASGAQGFFPEGKRGLSVTGAVTSLLPALVGPVKARELILLGEKHSAEEFHQLGVAWRVVPEEQLESEALKLAQKLIPLSPTFLAGIKKGIFLGSGINLDRILEYETEIAVNTVLDQSAISKVQQFKKR